MFVADIWREILRYCNQFDLHNLLLVCKAFYNHPVLQNELKLLKDWCAERAELITIHRLKYYLCINYYNDSDTTFFVNVNMPYYQIASFNVKAKLINPCDTEVYTPDYILSQAEQQYFLNRFNAFEVHAKNLYYYPNARFNIYNYNDIIIKPINMSIYICIKVKCDSGNFNFINVSKYAYPRAGYCFALYDAYNIYEN